MLVAFRRFVRHFVRQKSLRRSAFWGPHLHAPDCTNVRFVLQVQVFSARIRPSCAPTERSILAETDESITRAGARSPCGSRAIPRSSPGAKALGGTHRHLPPRAVEPLVQSSARQCLYMPGMLSSNPRQSEKVQCHGPSRHTAGSALRIFADHNWRRHRFLNRRFSGKTRGGSLHIDNGPLRWMRAFPSGNRGDRRGSGASRTASFAGRGAHVHSPRYRVPASRSFDSKRPAQIPSAGCAECFGGRQMLCGCCGLSEYASPRK